MRDTMSGNSRGFGFVAFREKSDADQAIASMNGELLGSRNIRVNWATQKSQSDTPPPRPGQQLPYETVLQQTPAYVTSVYVGNLPPNTTGTKLKKKKKKLELIIYFLSQIRQRFIATFPKIWFHSRSQIAS